MRDPSEFISCDWGTSTFRLRWALEGGRVVAGEIRENVGVRALCEQAQASGAANEAERGPVFEAFLREKLERLAAGQGGLKQPVPLVISGMASSTVGWHELPYAPLPFHLDGRGLRHAEIEWPRPDWISNTFLISGAAHRTDIMRGEETEILGLMAADMMKMARDECVLILPGTHSKHIQIRNDAVVDFHTFMTGELFEVLGRHSLLRASVQVSPDGISASRELTAEELHAFEAGVQQAKQRGLAGGLFGVRTRSVLDHKPSNENARFLSGLLVGAELLQLEAVRSPIYVAASGPLAQLYGAALSNIREDSGGFWCLSAEMTAHATVAGHAMFLKQALSPARGSQDSAPSEA